MHRLQAGLLCLFLVLLSSSMSAQPELLPSIGIGALPDDESIICDIPLYLGDFAVTGYFTGDTIPEFNLYDSEGNELIISDLLAAGKPVLIVNGSYTCPVFRSKISVINDLHQQFGDVLKIIIVYTVEAHPIEDISPYFGFVNPGNTNFSQGVLYNQPTTYGERKAIVADMLANMDIQVPVYIDGPCNDWWAHFGPAPNNAYLIDTDGTVLAKHPWFDKHPEDIYCDLNELLGLPAPCNPVGGGAFTFEMVSAPSVSGPAGSTIYVSGKLTNNTNAGVEVEIVRLIEDLPPDWSTSLCTDVCYPSDQTEAIIWLEAGEELDYTNYFYTSAQPDTGIVKIGFRNTADTTNSFIQWMGAGTYLATGTAEAEELTALPVLFPNPAKAGSLLRVTGQILPPSTGVRLYTSSGALVPGVIFRNQQIHIPYSLLPGVYYYQLIPPQGKAISGQLMIQ